MTVTITGASGFIGRRLMQTLPAEGDSVRALNWRAGATAPPDALKDADAVVHLAGEPVAQRWTPEAKARIRESRVAGTRRLVEALAALDRRPAVLICASAIGIYGSRGRRARSGCAGAPWWRAPLRARPTTR